MYVTFSLYFSKHYYNLLSINLGNDSNPLISGSVISYRAYSPDWIVLDNWVFQNFILADEPFAEALRILENRVSVHKNLCGKLVLSLELPVKFNERFKVISVSYFIAGFTC